MAIHRQLRGRELIAQQQGDAKGAAARYREGLTLAQVEPMQAAGPQLRAAPCLEAIAGWAAEQRQPERAARLLGAAAALRECMGTPLPPVAVPEYERSVAAIRAALGEAAVAGACEEGRAMASEQAIALAMELTKPP